MLEEVWHWLRIRSGPEARQLGYRKEAAALRARHRRCREAWRPHLEATQLALAHSAALATEGTGKGGCAVILGAGLLEDIPWARLTQHFDRIVLADIVFHPEVRDLARRQSGQFELWNADITGCVARLAGNPNSAELGDVATDLLSLPPLCEARWIASVNLLSQLALLPCAHLLRHGVAESRVEEFGVDLMRQHLHMLRQSPAALCIVTETRDMVRSAVGSLLDVTSRVPLMEDCLGDRPRHTLSQWQWLVHPRGELQEGQTELREVQALHMPAL